MIRARQIAEELGLDMKIGDVEFQGDGTKAIFYYIADGRSGFQTAIKVFADEFRIRIEMKQIGARQRPALSEGWEYAAVSSAAPTIFPHSSRYPRRRQGARTCP